MKVGRLFLCLILLLMTSCAWADELKPQKPGKEDKCPVCGMFVAKYPDFVAEIVFSDGARIYFDGCKDMFKYYLNLEKYNPGKRTQDIAAIYVTNYYNMEPIAGTRALYVVGSNVYGPMGKELIPFENQADADEFMVDHAGKSLLEFRAVTPEVLQSLE